MNFKRILTIFYFFLLAPGIFATTYYVDNQLTDNCVGNYSIANRDCSENDGDGFNTVQEAIDVSGPGDLIYLRGGTYYPTAQTKFNKSGTSNEYIELHSYPGENPVIDGADVPEGNTSKGSVPTWSFSGSDSKYWKIKGPLHITNGRGAGIVLDDGGGYIEFELVESSYNGKRAASAGHGFFIYNTGNLLFKNCDAHHNANHLWTGVQLDNQYQHGDGWRIHTGRANIKLVGCRAWHNLDDSYDYAYMNNAVEMIDCWSAYAAYDDAAGSLTGTPNKPMPQWEGDGLKLGYAKDNGQHTAIRCLSWNNHCHGWTVRGGPYKIYNSVSYNNNVDRAEAFSGITNRANVRLNTYGFLNNTGDGGGGAEYSSLSVSSEDFITLDDTGMFGPRGPNGELPETNFLRLSPESDLIDAGIIIDGYHCPTPGEYPDEDCSEWYGSAPDIGPFEFEESSADECVTLQKLMNYIGWWKYGGINMVYLMEKTARWKSGEGCS